MVFVLCISSDDALYSFIKLTIYMLIQGVSKKRGPFSKLI